MKHSKYILENGTRVVIVPMESVQTVSVQILVEAGSKYENKENNGISHFLEHMMFKGTKKRPTTKEISEEMDSVGGEYNAFTGKEQTGYWVKVPAVHFEKALDVVSDLYLNSKIEQAEIDKERGVILQEVAMYGDTPMRQVWEVFEELMYGDQPAGWEILGTKENIKGLNREEFTKYIQEMYLPKSTVISIAGNVKDAEALALVEKYFNIRQSSRIQKEKKKVVELQSKPHLKIQHKKTDQTHFILGVRGPHMFSKDRFAAVLLGTILGGGMSSRAFLNIREKHGLTYYINASTEMMTDTGYAFMSAGVQHEKLKKAIGLVLKELSKMKDKLVSQKELRKAKEYLKGKTLMSLESTNSVASFVGDQELFRKEVSTAEELLEKIEEVEAEDVQKIANNIFKDTGLNLAVIGPHENEEELKEILTFK